MWISEAAVTLALKLRSGGTGQGGKKKNPGKKEGPDRLFFTKKG
jgi:hypothetical protein